MRYILDYVWLGGNSELRSKIRVIESEKSIFSKGSRNSGAVAPCWSYDGSSTEQADRETSEINLFPVAVYDNPLMLPQTDCKSYIVLCETRDKDMKCLEGSNHRFGARRYFRRYQGMSPWFGLEQEYFILNDEIKERIDDGVESGDIVQGQFYCSVGAKNAFLRNIVERHMMACLKAGLKISGINAEVAPYQWEFQIGPCEGIEAGDQLWVARYLMERIAEEEGYYIDWSPKPFVSLNGSGCHTNFSTQIMREDEDGIDFMFDCISRMEKNHQEDMRFYGDDNDKRMIGELESASFDTFKFDPEKPVDRGGSVRIGYETMKNRRGYFEDRRPASNMDPYLVTQRVMMNATGEGGR